MALYRNGKFGGWGWTSAWFMKPSVLKLWLLALWICLNLLDQSLIPIMSFWAESSPSINMWMCINLVAQGLLGYVNLSQPPLPIYDYWAIWKLLTTYTNIWLLGHLKSFNHLYQSMITRSCENCEPPLPIYEYWAIWKLWTTSKNIWLLGHLCSVNPLDYLMSTGPWTLSQSIIT